MPEKCSTGYFDSMQKIGSVHRKFLWFAAFAYFFDQMDVSLFGQIAPAIRSSWGVSLEQIGRLNSLSFWGMCFGGIFGGWLGDKIGRKKALLCSMSIFSLASIGNGLFNNMLLFEICRFLTGFGTISMVIVAMVYISEMLPAHSRGKYQSLTIASGTIGVPIGSWLARFIIPLGPTTWKYVFIIGGGAILLVPLGYLWLKESPRWLVLKGRLEEAEAVVTACTGQPSDLSVYASDCNEKRTSMIGAVKLACSKDYAKRSVVILFLVIGTTVGGFFLGNWYTTLFTEMGFSLTLVLTAMAIASFGGPIGDFCSSFVTDRGGRKKPIVICFVLLGGLFLIQGFLPTPQSFVVLQLLRMMLMSAGSTMMWTYMAESFPTQIRGTMNGLLMAVARVMTAVSMNVVPALFVSIGFLGLHVINAAFFFIPAILVLALGEKTAHLTLEELEK